MMHHSDANSRRGNAEVCLYSCRGHPSRRGASNCAVRDGLAIAWPARARATKVTLMGRSLKAASRTHEVRRDAA
jgi:hypothetical protein